MNLTPSRGSALLLFGAGLAFAGAMTSLARRAAVERANKSVTLAVESDVVQSLAAGSRVGFPQALARLKTAGFTGLVVSEETLGEVIAENRAGIVSGDLLGNGNGPRPAGRQALIVTDPSLVPRVEKGLAVRFGGLMPGRSQPVGQGVVIALPQTDVGLIRGTSLFLPPDVTDGAKKAGMSIIARAGNPSGVGDDAIAATLRELKSEGASVFLPSGETVIGRRDGTPTTVATMKETGLLYASPEFAKLGGDVEMLKALPEQTVRLHSAQSAELDKLSPSGAVDRYVKAAAERDMRILLLRPMGAGGGSPLEAFAKMGEEIVHGVGRSGLTPGTAAPFADPAPPKLFGILTGLGIGLATLGSAMMVGGRRIAIAGGVLGVLAVLGTLHPRGIEGTALLGALVLPFGGFVAAYRARLSWPLAVLVATGVSLIGGLSVAGLLNSLPYLVRAETFSGVKLAVFLPVAAAGAYAFARLADFRGALRASITWGSALLGLVVLAILGVMIVRSGNDAPAGVSGGELAFRGLLEDLLPVRPRTKEFLIGFPALVVGFAWLAAAGYDRDKLRGKGGWVALLLMLGAIALTDVVNTFCHIHTPLAVSALRVLLGLLFGGIIGAVLWLALRTRLLKAPLAEAASPL